MPDPWEILLGPSRQAKAEPDDPWSVLLGEDAETKRRREEKRRQLEAIRRGQGLPGAKPALGKVPEPDTSLGAILKEGAQLAGAAIIDNIATSPKTVEQIITVPSAAAKRAIQGKPVLAPETLREAERLESGAFNSLTDRTGAIHRRQTEDFARATQNLPTPVSAGLYGLLEGGALLADPTNLPEAGALAKPRRALPEALETAGERALRRTIAPVENVAERASQRAIPGPALDELARASENLAPAPARGFDALADEALTNLGIAPEARVADAMAHAGSDVSPEAINRVARREQYVRITPGGEVRPIINDVGAVDVRVNPGEVKAVIGADGVPRIEQGRPNPAQARALSGLEAAPPPARLADDIEPDVYDLGEIDAPGPTTPPGRPDVLPDVPDVLPDAQPLPRAEPDLAAARPGEAGSVSLGPANSLKRWLKENFLSGGRFRAAADDFAPGSEARAFVESVPRSFIEPQAGRYQAAIAQQDRLQRELFQAVRAEKKAAGAKPRDLFEQIQRVRAGDEPLSALPARLQPVVQRQFDFLDGLTQRMLDEGAIPDELVQAVEANRNYYHRAYQKYDVPDWQQKVQGTPNWARAEEFLRGEMPDATPDEILGLMNRLADSDTGPDVLATFAGAPSRLNNVLRSRKNIPEPIRALMGEYKDWRVSFEKSVHNLAWDLTVHQMNRELREAGLEAGAFRLGADGPSGAIYRDIPVSRKVGDVAARSPLDDVLASPGFVRAMSKELEVARNNWFHKLSSVVNIGKTLGNFPAGYIRNAVVHPLTTVVNGHNPADVGRWRRVVESWQSPSTLNRMLELGLIDGGVNAKEIQDYVNVIEQAQNPAVRASAAVGKKLASWWNAGDDSFRVYNWLAETEALMEARPTMPRPAAEALAADRVKDTFQTYARAPHVAKALRRTLLGSPGTTFAIESTRNLGNIARIAKADIEEGIRTGNTGLVRLGMKRVFGLTAGAVATASLPAVGRYASGFFGEKSGEGEAMDRDQLDAVRRWVAPHYHENAELLPLHFKPGQEILYQDISFLNPYSVLSRPALAMRRGVTEGQSGVPDAVFEFLDQVAGGNIAGTTALEVLANRRLRQRWPMEFGGPIANFDEGRGQAIGKLAYHAYRGAAPGAISQIENLARASGALPQQEGRDRTLGTEVASTLGARVTKLNIPDAFRKNAAVWDERSGRLKPRLPKGAGPEAAGEIAERYIGNWDNLYQEARAMVEDFKKLGMTNEQIYQQARKAGVKPKPYPGTSGVFWDPIGGALGGAEHFPPPPMWPSTPEEGALAAAVFSSYRARYGTP